ncbi:MAG: inositol monophosphatase [Bdellovibrionales bacterium]|nr:inositol monophosphatase [Bdellovibrionales bacterium]
MVSKLNNIHNLDIQSMLDVARQASRLGQEILIKYFGDLKNVSEKAMAGLVSEADLASEEAIIGVFKKATPSFEIVAEEDSFKNKKSGLTSSTEGRWIIDPLDGTTNYVYGLPIFCTSIALEINGEVILGVIDVPLLKKSYWCIKGQGAFLNDQPIKVSTRSSLKQSLLATGFFAQNDELIDRQMKYLSKVIHHCRGVRRVGSAAFDLCMVAEGVFDGYWEENLSPWDTAAGFLLVLEAGGKVSDYSGQKYDPYKKSILATNGLVHEELKNYFI